MRVNFFPRPFSRAQVFRPSRALSSRGLSAAQVRPSRPQPSVKAIIHKVPARFPTPPLVAGSASAHLVSSRFVKKKYAQKDLTGRSLSSSLAFTTFGIEEKIHRPLDSPKGTLLIPPSVDPSLHPNKFPPPPPHPPPSAPSFPTFTTKDSTTTHPPPHERPRPTRQRKKRSRKSKTPHNTGPWGQNSPPLARKS